MKTKNKRKEYEEFTDKQFGILKGHFDRCMLRCYCKYGELFTEPIKVQEEASND